MFSPRFRGSQTKWQNDRGMEGRRQAHPKNVDQIVPMPPIFPVRQGLRGGPSVRLPLLDVFFDRPAIELRSSRDFLERSVSLVQ